jgi:hypothetical protein
MSDGVERLLRPVFNEATRLITGSTVAILKPGKDGKSLQNDSTGVLIQIADSHFLLSVAHSMSGYTKNRIPIYAFGSVPGSKAVVLGDSQALNFGSGDLLDAGVLRLTPKAVDELSRTMTFLRLDQVEVDHPLSVDHCYVVTGFPELEFEPDPVTGEVSMEVLRYITSPYAQETEILKRFNPVSAYAFDYEQKTVVAPDGSSVYMPLPYGLSGGGIWTLGHRKSYSKFKVEDIRLVAIEFGFYEKWGPIVGTKLGVVLSLIYRTYPELRSSIDLHPRSSWPNCPGFLV